MCVYRCNEPIGRYYDNMNAWFAAHVGNTFRYWEIKKPFEYNSDYEDESRYVSDYATRGILREMVKISDDDYLLGFELSDSSWDHKYMEYRKFSEITIDWYETEQSDYKESKEDERYTREVTHNGC